MPRRCLEGEPAATPVVLNDRAYTIRVRFPEQSRASLDRMSNTLLTSATGRTATLGSLATISTDPGQTEIRRENLQRLVEVTGRFEGVSLGQGMQAVQKTVEDLKLPSSIRVEYGGLYEEQQKSFRDLLMVFVAGAGSAVRRAAVRISDVFRADSDSGVGAALDIWRIFGAVGHADYIQCGVVHGDDHGGRHRGEERHSATGCRPTIPATGISARKNR